MRAHASILAVALAALTVAGCGSGGRSTTALPPPTSTVRIYAALPMQLTSRQGQEVLAGVRMALDDADHRAGPAAVRLVVADDGDASGNFDPSLIQGSAYRAVVDPQAVGVVGGMYSDETALLAPILNRGGLAEVSPSSSAIGLTNSVPGDPRAPERYFPTGTRTFARLIPNDIVQGAAITELLGEEGVRKLAIVRDGSTYGRDLATEVAGLARRNGIDVTRDEQMHRVTGVVDALADRIDASGADAMLFAGSSVPRALALGRALGALGRQILLFAPDALASPDFVGALGPLAERTFVTSPALPVASYSRAGQRLVARLRRQLGHEPGPYAVLGYESTRALLDAIARAGRDGSLSGGTAVARAAVVRQLFDPHQRSSALGGYSIASNGDTTLTIYGAYRVRDGKLVKGRVLQILPSMAARRDAR